MVDDMVELPGKYGTDCARHVVEVAAKCVEARAVLLDPIRAVAKRMGYAVAVHGSIARDFDLIAIPWTDEAVEPELLAQSVAKLVAAYFEGWSRIDDDCPRRKPHGRLAWSIHGLAGFYLDFGVIEPRDAA